MMIYKADETVSLWLIFSNSLHPKPKGRVYKHFGRNRIVFVCSDEAMDVEEWKRMRTESCICPDHLERASSCPVHGRQSVSQVSLFNSIVLYDFLHVSQKPISLILVLVPKQLTISLIGN